MDEKNWPLKPLCKGMKRKEITDLLGDRLIDLRLTRRNAYTYWAHEVHVHDGDKEIRVDFMKFVPYRFGANFSAAGVERGQFVCYEVKSCLADMKSGSGLNFIGDINYLVCPIETYYEFIEKKDDDPKLHAIESMSNFSFLVFGGKRNGSEFLQFSEQGQWIQRKHSASELLFCMMRAMVANSDHSNVNHEIEGRFLK